MEELKIMQLNINSLNNKKEELKILIIENKPDIITLNETKMIYNEKVEIPGYTAVYSHRIGNKRGGGVATLLKNNIKFDKIQKIQIEKHEIIKIDLHFQEKIIHLVNCYIPPPPPPGYTKHRNPRITITTKYLVYWRLQCKEHPMGKHENKNQRTKNRGKSRETGSRNL